jgi:hypothetical protein
MRPRKKNVFSLQLLVSKVEGQKHFFYIGLSWNFHALCLNVLGEAENIFLALASHGASKHYTRMP